MAKGQWNGSAAWLDLKAIGSYLVYGCLCLCTVTLGAIGCSGILVWKINTIAINNCVAAGLAIRGASACGCCPSYPPNFERMTKIISHALSYPESTIMMTWWLKWHDEKRLKNWTAQLSCGLVGRPSVQLNWCGWKRLQKRQIQRVASDLLVLSCLIKAKSNPIYQKKNHFQQFGLGPIWAFCRR